MITHQPLHDGLRGAVQARLLPARRRLWREGASGTRLAQDLLNEGEADTEHVGNGALRAEWPLTGPEDLLT
jgi:hypothetical protein